MCTVQEVCLEVELVFPGVYISKQSVLTPDGYEFPKKNATKTSNRYAGCVHDAPHYLDFTKSQCYLSMK